MRACLEQDGKLSFREVQLVLLQELLDLRSIQPDWAVLVCLSHWRSCAQELLPPSGWEDTAGNAEACLGEVQIVLHPEPSVEGGAR